MNVLACCAVSLYAVLATCWDVRQRRIPNWLSGTFLVAAIPSAGLENGIGFIAAGQGFLIGAGAMFVPFLLGAVGGGDLKFVAVAGAWLGPRIGLNALLLGTVLGLFAALGAAAAAGRFGDALSGAARLVWLAAAGLSLTQLPPADRQAGKMAPIPYAAPLGAGVVGAVLLAHMNRLLI